MKTIKIAITVDDLPYHGSCISEEEKYADVINFLDILNNKKIAGIYGFINGKSIEEEYNLKKILDLWKYNGHKLGNHTYSHLDLRDTSSSLFINDILLNEPILKEFYSQEDLKFFRYPFLLEGETSEKRDSIRNFLDKNNYKIAQCTVDFRDFSFNNILILAEKKRNKKIIDEIRNLFIESSIYRINAAIKFSNSLFKRDIKHILLLHMCHITSTFFGDVIDAYKKIGCEFISLEEAIEDDIYKTNPNLITDKGMDFLSQTWNSRKLPYIDMPPLPITLSGLNAMEKSLKEEI